MMKHCFANGRKEKERGVPLSAVGASERRERERAEMRQRILDAARELFAEEGVDAVTLRKVAKKIEYSTTAIYVHFKDKAALLTELVELDFRAHASAFAGAMAIQDPLERLYELGKRYIEFGIENPNHYRLMFMTPRPDEGIGLAEADADDDGKLTSYRMLRLNVQAAIDAGVLKPEYTDPVAVSHVLWSLVHGVVSLHITKSGQKHFEWRAFVEIALNRVRHGGYSASRMTAMASFTRPSGIQ